MQFEKRWYKELFIEHCQMETEQRYLPMLEKDAQDKDYKKDLLSCCQ